MSRAFVKETETKARLPDRLVSPHRNFVTEAGLAAIEDALNRFEVLYREAVAAGDGPAIAAASREVRYWRARRSSVLVTFPSQEEPSSGPKSRAIHRSSPVCGTSTTRRSPTSGVRHNPRCRRASLRLIAPNAISARPRNHPAISRSLRRAMLIYSEACGATPAL
jgi:hypothetical protein